MVSEPNRSTSNIVDISDTTNTNSVLFNAEMGGGSFPNKPLSPHSFIEVQLNDIYKQYHIPISKQEELNQLVTSYNTAVQHTVEAIKSWKSKRGEEQLDINALLFLEKVELLVVSKQIQNLVDSNVALFNLLQSFKPKRAPKLNDYVSNLVKRFSR